MEAGLAEGAQAVTRRTKRSRAPGKTGLTDEHLEHDLLYQYSWIMRRGSTAATRQGLCGRPGIVGITNHRQASGLGHTMRLLRTPGKHRSICKPLGGRAMACRSVAHQLLSGLTFLTTLTVANPANSAETVNGITFDPPAGWRRIARANGAVRYDEPTSTASDSGCSVAVQPIPTTRHLSSIPADELKKFFEALNPKMFEALSLKNMGGVQDDVRRKQRPARRGCIR